VTTAGRQGAAPALSGQLVDRVRNRLAAAGVAVSPGTVAAAVRAESDGVLADLQVLSALRELQRELIGAGPLEPLLADPQTTLVVYMGLASADAVRDGLIKAGRDAKTPAGVFARGTRPDAQTVVGTLDELPALAQQAGEGPALLVIGEVVARSDAWRLAENHLAQELAA